MLNKKDPIILPHVSPEMLDPSFWISRGEERVAVAEPFIRGIPTYLGAVTGYLQTIGIQAGRRFYGSDGAPVHLEQWANVSDLAGLNKITQIYKPQFGLITEGTDLKLFPRADALLNDPAEQDLDRNQLSGLDLGEKVIIFARSLDGKWLGVITGQGVGWTLRETVAPGPESEVDSFLDSTPRLTLIDPELNLILQGEILSVNMGKSYPLKNLQRKEIAIPRCTSEGNLILADGVVEGATVAGHLEKTQSNLVRQAFKYLGYQYAWGDHDCEGYGRDCSRFVQNILATLGISSPRNSQEILGAGRVVTSLENLPKSGRLSEMRQAPLGGLIFTKSHVMIYLGEIGERFYVIHALYDYPVTADGVERRKRIKQITVSDLSLGEGTATGSLLERLTGIVRLF